MTVLRDAQGRQLRPDPCPGCGKPTKRLPRTGKARYRHRCSHGYWCPWGIKPNNLHVNNYPVTGGCPTCKSAFYRRQQFQRA